MALGSILCHWGYFVAFGIFNATSLYFSPFWYLAPRKIWQPCSKWKPSLAVGNNLLPTIGSWLQPSEYK
jgi:hypothetical protein